MKPIWGGVVAMALRGAAPAPPSIAPQAFIAGTAVRFDVQRIAAARHLRVVAIRLPRNDDGLWAAGGVLRGTPRGPAVLHLEVVVANVRGRRVTLPWPVVVFAAGLSGPALPDTLFPYSDIRMPTPRHFLADVTGSAFAEDNSPRTNRVTDAGATLGRVLFYDTRLSADDRVACASCHKQEFGFADTARFSRGIGGALTRRHTMALANARYYRNARFFRDERAATLEAQVLQPIADRAEMGLPLDAMTLKLSLTPFYAPLFNAAFGTPGITGERVSLALAQFVRSLVSNRARLDSVFRGGGPANLAMLTQEERQGRSLFIGRAGCARCHRTNALELDLPDNIGLDSVPADTGAGHGRFKAPSLRNVAIRPPYMHDGRFSTLDQVVTFYDSGIQADPNLDLRLRQPDGSPQRLHLTDQERAAIVAYLNTFTDRAFLSDPRFSDPFEWR